MSDFPPADHGATRLEILPVTGMPDLRPGDDLVAAVADAAPQLQDGDVVVVTSKVVSKIEGRLITLPTADADVREQARREAVDEESVRVVATRGDLRIVQNRQGLVLAAAGVDSSNVARNELALVEDGCALTKWIATSWMSTGWDCAGDADLSSGLARAGTARRALRATLA